ncbi:hypothetical protein KC334_g14727 [Hortaea werneckii]|nr:hypothetical protein KC334_g14727 [Hortaea werneckii]
MARSVVSRTTTGTWIPSYVPSGSGSSRIIAGLLVFCSIITSTTFGYDGSMLNGLNILPEYTNYFHLTSATTGLQTSAVFIVVIARILIGFGTAASGCGGPPFLAETLPLHWRGWGLGIFNDCYYGKWLAYQGHHEAAHTVLAQTYADGDRDSPVVVAALKEIVDTLEYEKNNNEKLSLSQCFRTPSARRRIALACSAAVFSTISGNVIASYYLGSLLTLAGITSTKVQLEVNIILNAWSLVCALCGTFSVDRLGRKTTALASATTLTVIIFIEGALTKVYGTSNNDSGIYATVASVFLFMGAYSFGWTPLLYLYPPEVLNYPIRAVGVGMFQFVANGTAVLIVFTMPIALDNIDYITYFVNGAWDVLVIIIIAVFWVETKGKTLEELDVIFEGEKHSDAPELVLVYRGEANVSAGKNVQTVEESQSSQQSSEQST